MPVDVMGAPGVGGAFEQGVARVSGLLDQFSKGAERVTRQAALRKLLADMQRDDLLAPLRTAAEEADLRLKQGRAQAELEILPKQTGLLSEQLNIATKQLPVASEEADVAVADALTKLKWRKEALRRDPTGSLWRAYELYTAVFPHQAPPMTSEGMPDFDQVVSKVSPVLTSLQAMQLGGSVVGKDLLTKATDLGVPVVDATGGLRPLADVQRDVVEAQKKNDPARKTLFEEAAKLGVPIVDEANRLRSAEEVQRDLKQARDAAAAPKLTGEQLMEATQQLSSLSELLKRIYDLQSRVFAQVAPTGEVLSSEAKVNVLGPIVGAWPVNKILPFVASERAALQDEFRRLAADLTRANARELKGALSDKDVLFLKEAVAQPSQTEASWREFLNRVRPALERRQKELQSQLEALSKSGPIKAGLLSTAARSDSNVVVVNSVAEARKLRPGTFFRLAGDTTEQLYRVPPQ